MTHTNPAYYDDTDAYEPTDHERVDVAELEERWEAGRDAH